MSKNNLIEFEGREASTDPLNELLQAGVQGRSTENHYELRQACPGNQKAETTAAYTPGTVKRHCY